MKEQLQLPVLPLKRVVVLPGVTMSLELGKNSSKQIVKDAFANNINLFFGTLKHDGEMREQADFISVGTVAKILQINSAGNGKLQIVVQGIYPANIEELIEENDGFYVKVTELETIDELDENKKEAFRRTILDFVKQYWENPSKKEMIALKRLSSTKDLEQFINEVLVELNMAYEYKAKILEQERVEQKAFALIEIMANELEIAALRANLQKKFQNVIDENQKKYIYRQEIKVLKKELGEAEDTDQKVEEYSKRLEEINACEEVKTKIKKEINRFSSFGGNSYEAGMQQSYIECLLDLPWNQQEKENKNLKQAARILEQDHYGLEKIKERVVDYLAVHMYYPDAKAPILCLVGPPGTGKTSIATSIARALNRKFCRISLGGVRDESVLRGHRRTYVGAMPGRIVDALKKAKSNNPLILLDEIDKMSADYKGDLSSAMLEVLDSEQNKTFRDHYVDMELDLSNVLFLATANSLESIPRPLMDRMEIISLGSYTVDEKMHIAKKYLIPKQMKKHGLDNSAFSIGKKQLQFLIESYTREAGVRQLERELAGLCRKVVKKRLDGEIENLKIRQTDMEDILGKPKYQQEHMQGKSEIGLVRGLAWTQVGGDTLPVEAIAMKGSGKITYSGNLGDVMKESAQIAGLFVRSLCTDSFFKDHDVHIHVPEGAVPKDGPSAGITMATAVYSAVHEIPVKSCLAMTGELSLRGKVLPIGGLKEKLTEAKAIGIKEVIVPKKNKKEVDELSKEITNSLNIHYVTEMKEVLAIALEEKNGH